MDIYLETERLYLRRLTPDDVDDLLALHADPEVMRWINGGVPASRASIEHDLLPAWLDYYERGSRFGFWAAVEKESGQFLGWFHFRPLSDAPEGEVELGYRLGRAAWGKGYATEGSLALIDKGFGEFGVRRVVASTYEDNLASRRVMEKSGLRLVRRYRISPEELLASGEYENADPEQWSGDDVEYALTREEWERERAGEGR